MTFTPPVTAPRQTAIAYWLYLVGAALGLIGLIVTLIVLPSQLNTISGQAAAQGTTVSAAALRAGIIIGVVISVVLSLAYTVVFVIFDRLMVRGRNWARIVLAVLAGLQIFGVLGTFGLGALHFIVLAVAAVLTFLPESNAYFRTTVGTTAPPAATY